MNDDLYPVSQPYHEGRLSVGDGHELFYQLHGNPEGIPVVVLHGGPGAGCSSVHPRFFDPAAYKIVLFDQRGCGRSTPLGSLVANTTADLVSDIEKLRTHLGIRRWLVFGGSWGSFLGIAYAGTHPEACSAIVLRGIWLCRQSDLDWWLGPIRGFYPDHFDAFANVIPPEERDDLLAAYSRRLMDPDPAVHMPAAVAWETYETVGSSLLGTLDEPVPASEATLATVRIKAHYMRHLSFVGDGDLLRSVERFAHLPGTIVHGRYDMLCFLDGAFALAARWPGAQLHVIQDAGHSVLEPGIRSALIEATNRLRDTLAVD